MANALITTIYAGYRIKTADDIYTVKASAKARSGYKYVCLNAAGKKVTIDRNDLIAAQKDGSAIVLGAAA